MGISTPLKDDLTHLHLSGRNVNMQRRLSGSQYPYAHGALLHRLGCALLNVQVIQLVEEMDSTVEEGRSSDK